VARLHRPVRRHPHSLLHSSQVEIISTMYAKIGLPDDIFSKQNPNLGKFLRVLQWNMLMDFMAIWYIRDHF
jgi:hypothetical protein